MTSNKMENFPSVERKTDSERKRDKKSFPIDFGKTRDKITGKTEKSFPTIIYVVFRFLIHFEEADSCK